MWGLLLSSSTRSWIATPCHHRFQILSGRQIRVSKNNTCEIFDCRAELQSSQGTFTEALQFLPMLYLQNHLQECGQAMPRDRSLLMMLLVHHDLTRTPPFIQTYDMKTIKAAITRQALLQLMQSCNCTVISQT